MLAAMSVINFTDWLKVGSGSQDYKAFVLCERLCIICIIVATPVVSLHAYLAS